MAADDRLHRIAAYLAARGFDPEQLEGDLDATRRLSDDAAAKQHIFDNGCRLLRSYKAKGWNAGRCFCTYWSGGTFQSWIPSDQYRDATRILNPCKRSGTHIKSGHGVSSCLTLGKEVCWCLTLGNECTCYDFEKYILLKAKFDEAQTEGLTVRMKGNYHARMSRVATPDDVCLDPTRPKQKREWNKRVHDGVDSVEAQVKYRKLMQIAAMTIDILDEQDE